MQNYKDFLYENLKEDMEKFSNDLNNIKSQENVQKSPTHSVEGETESSPLDKIVVSYFKEYDSAKISLDKISTDLMNAINTELIGKNWSKNIDEMFKTEEDKNKYLITIRGLIEKTTPNIQKILKQLGIDADKALHQYSIL
jgi:hypothetical protein